MGNLPTTLPNYLSISGLVAWHPFNGNANDLASNPVNGNVNNAVLTLTEIMNPTKRTSLTGLITI